MNWSMAPVRLHRGHVFGNVVMSRFPFVTCRQHDLTWKRRTPRGCQAVDLRIGEGILHVYNVHFGTGLRERRYQADRLAGIIEEQHLSGPKIVLGDFNEWGRGVATSLLTPKLQSLDLRTFLKRRRTYPGFFPVLHLDHMFYDGKIEVVRVQAPRTNLTLVASDHLPLITDLRVQF